MAHILQSDIVRYACTCGSLKPISRIYFCRHCLKIRCGYCVSHEVDSHYCANCLENLPSAEARLKKQRCASCFDCPSCLHTLSTRASTVIIQGSDETKTVTKKMYYLACGFCRWTSRDIGVPDQPVASGGWAERENPHVSRINSLLEHYKTLALREKQEKEKKKFMPRRNYYHLSGLSAAMARKRAGLAPLGTGSLKDDLGGPIVLAPAVASSEVEQLPEDIFTTPINLLKITTLKQRLAQPEFQPETVNDLYPAHKCLLIKRSQRCRSCEHNVSKPEYNPGSIKFKIQLSAYYHVPEIRIVTCEPLRIGSSSELIIKICNPTQHQSSVQFVPLPSPEEEEEELKKEIEERKQKLERRDELQTSFLEGKRNTQFDRAGSDLGIENIHFLPRKSQKTTRDDVSLLIPSMCRQISITEDPRPVKATLTGDVELPPSTVVLPPRDDAAEYDDSGDTYNFQDDPKVVVWRKANKAAVKLLIKPNTNAKEGGDVLVGFVMNYTYVNTMATLEQKEPQKLHLKVKLYITVGRVVGN